MPFEQWYRCEVSQKTAELNARRTTYFILLCEVGKGGADGMISLYKLILYNLRNTAIRTRPES